MHYGSNTQIYFEHTNQLFGAVKSESLDRERAQMVDVFMVIKDGKIIPKILFLWVYIHNIINLM